MATTEQLALARKIVSEFIWTPDDGDLSRRTGPQQNAARDMEKAILAAIIETTELAISCGDTLYEPPVGTWQAMAVERYQNILRNFDHLKEPSHGE